MVNIILKSKIREVFGKQNKKLRQKGLIPGVVYGRKTKPLALTLDLKEFLNIYHQAGDTDLIDLVIDNQGQEITKKVLVQTVNRDYVTSQPIHIDFYEVEMDKPVTTHVPLVFIGESPSVKAGGVLVKSMDEIEIEALPKDLPHQIEIDISPLDTFDKTIYVKDIKLPNGVKSLVKEDTPIVTVTAPITEEELEAELGKAKTVEEVEVEGEKKPEEMEVEAGEEAKEGKEPTNEPQKTNE
ncbi:MAG: 50S ribosomal protein L25 [Parcubacteria group bacterium]|nr:50S ribosomal protein L25 [Parcubacteria group bacterium]